ncbi:phosphatase PAP2 family protein [Paenibacillus sp. R14(2021)]|uniref:phosphatase PAP2 family protein n=1 Tax=Paenibacillus sp. R14(2021) TaxID=2859228 RepID=UPI001C6122E7|nr:phosphatase PAP2 family protein [Paenibacillus sp. R14(2021)]
MQFVDQWTIEWINHHVVFSIFMNKIIHMIADNDEFKGLLFMTIFWSLWFHNSKQSSNRITLLGMLTGSFFALLISRTITEVIVNRPRPMIESTLNFRIPSGLTLDLLPKMSSFPSDHAVMFFGMALGFLFVSRRVGVFAFSYTALFIAFPRVYMGYHYPTDIAAGMLIGLVVVFLFTKQPIIRYMIEQLIEFGQARPMLMYPFLFLLTFEFATMFDNIRHFASGLLGHSM